MADRLHLRVHKFMTNPLLRRKQMVLEVLHSGKAAPTKADVKRAVAKMYKSTNPDAVTVFGMRTGFGGGRTTGFALVYDDMDAVKKYEPKYRLRRIGLAPKKDGSRKQRRERKNRAKKFRGLEKAKILQKK